VLIGKKLKQLRESKDFTQRDIKKKTNLRSAYISRVEKGHTTPSVATLEKYATAVDVHLYELFYEGDEPPKHLIRFTADNETIQNEMAPLAKAVARLNGRDRTLLLANQMARKHMRKARQ
jgi:transcriptional regulator with XRE-family HTH domain